MSTLFSAVAAIYKNFFCRRRKSGLALMFAMQIGMTAYAVYGGIQLDRGFGSGSFFAWSLGIIAAFGWFVALPAFIYLVDTKSTLNRAVISQKNDDIRIRLE